MGNGVKQLLTFGPFRIDAEQRLLLRDEKPVPLSPKAFDLLIVLAQRSGQIVTKDDLMKLLWPDTFVEESNLGQHVFQLRKALGDRSQDSAYIVTVPGRGYRFAQRVETLPEEESIVVESHSRSRVVIEERMAPVEIGRPGQRRFRIHPALIAVLAAAIVAGIFFRPEVPAPKVTRIRQLTHLGTVIHNAHLTTDGPRVYFRAWDGKERIMAYVSIDGGEPVRMERAFPQIDIDDISPNGSEFLALDMADPPYPATDLHTMWRVPITPGSPRPVAGLHAVDSRWSPDGSTILYDDGSDLYVANADGSNPRKVKGLPGRVFHFQWAPDGRRIRFARFDQSGRSLAMWEADLAAGTSRALLPNWPRSISTWPAHWTPDGNYFLFTGFDGGSRDIWAMREPQGTLRRVNPQPVRITAGPINFYQPTPSRDGKSVFAIGQQLRGQLVRYDKNSQQCLPFAGGISADHVAFSRDGQWMAYVSYPEGTLVRSRVDGSERRQLTFPPMRAWHPQWSPDGTQLAFQASKAVGEPYKIYLISRDGGPPVLATPERNDHQLYPSWTADANAIVFSGSDLSDEHSALYRLDVKSKNVSLLAGTEGLYWGQISPDGGSIAALTDPAQKLVLYDVNSHQTKTLAALADYPSWSSDGKFLYYSTLFFRDRDPALFRWQASTGSTETVMGLPPFMLGGVWGTWFGLTPQGDPLVVRDISTTDLYALDLELP